MKRRMRNINLKKQNSEKKHQKCQEFNIFQFVKKLKKYMHSIYYGYQIERFRCRLLVYLFVKQSFVSNFCLAFFKFCPKQGLFSAM